MDLPCRSALLCLSFGCLLFSGTLQAKPLLIIHTNDLHSHMERMDALPDTGGFAAVKAKIDALKAEAQAQGIPSLVLDAGDFSEGTEFFFADEGRQSWKLISEMGYDAVAMGNHDYQMGTLELDRMLGFGFPGLNLLSANFRAEPGFTNIANHLHPFTQFIRDGLKIAVLGLTTNELVYRWAAKPGAEVEDPLETAEHWAPQLARKNDAVIALTHLGVDTDVELAGRVRGLDLIVGGHSHTVLEEPVMIPSPDNHFVPIVQTGAHGQYVGNLLVDIEPGFPLQLLRYRLEPVIPSQVGEDPVIAASVREARRALERRYGAEWLYQPIAQSEIPMENPKPRPSRWGELFAESIREAAGTDIGLDDSEFFGSTQPEGAVTREKLIQFYPRCFEPAKPLGWTIWTVEVHGAVLKEAIQRTYKADSPFLLAGVTFDVTEDEGGELKFSNFRVGDQKLDLLRRYKVATSEGLGKGTRLANFFLGKYFDSKDVGIPVWSAVEAKLKAMGGIVKAGAEPLRLERASRPVSAR